MRLNRLAVSVIAITSIVGGGFALSSQATCWKDDSVSCCQQAGAQLTVRCNVGGVRWTCPALVEVSPDIEVAVPDPKGMSRSDPTGVEGRCSYKKAKCGTRAEECGHQSLSTKLVCEGSRAAGSSCDLSGDSQAAGDGQWDLDFALMVDGHPYALHLGGHTCGSGTQELLQEP